jgi:hypothetical protein
MTAKPLAHRRRPRLIAFDGDAHSLSPSIAETERAVPGDRIDRPAIGRHARSLRFHDPVQIRSRLERTVFDGLAEAVADDEPTRFVHRIERISFTASSSGHVRSMPQCTPSSASGIANDCMAPRDYALAMAAKKNFNRAAAIVLINICALAGCSVTSPEPAKGKAMESISETTSSPPYTFGKLLVGLIHNKKTE